jgi:hypothetical protein
VQAEDMHMGLIVARVDKRIMRVSVAPQYSHCHVQPYMDTVGLSLCMAQLLKIDPPEEAMLCSNDHSGISPAFLS